MKYRLKTVTITANETSDTFATSPRTAVAILRAIFATLDTDREHFLVLTLDPKGKVQGYKVLGSGTATATMASPADVFRTALLLGGISVLCAHNHPSGDPRPSREDALLTDKLRKAGDFVDVALADHIILGNNATHYSFRTEGAWDR